MSSNRVLIVDDEPDVLESTGMLVESLGYPVILVKDAREILETIEREKPAVVLQDLKMPGLDIAALMATLRASPETADLPVVFFSANADVAAMAADLDAWGFLAKPFTEEELAQLLAKVMGAPAQPGPPIPHRDLEQHIRAAFHDYWNLLAALNNYVAILRRSPDLSAQSQHAVHGMEDLIIKLEARADRLRKSLLTALGAPNEATDDPHTLSSQPRKNP